MVEIIENSVLGSPEITNPRKTVMLDFYARPTIPFELECESEGYKKNLATEISTTAKAINGMSFARLFASTSGIAGVFIVACASHCLFFIPNIIIASCTKSEKVLDIMGTVFYTVWALVCVIFAVILSADLFAYPARKSDSIENIRSIK